MYRTLTLALIAIMAADHTTAITIQDVSYGFLTTPHVVTLTQTTKSDCEQEAQELQLYKDQV